MGADTELLQELADKEAIRQLMARYTRGIDRQDIDLIRSAYHSDAYDNHGQFKGPATEFAEWAVAQLTPDSVEHIQHYVTNTLIELKGIEAHVESLFIQVHVKKPDERGVQVFDHMGGRYLDRMDKRDGVWRIAERHVVVDWCENHPYNPRITPYTQGVIGRRDTSYDFLQFEFKGLLL